MQSVAHLSSKQVQQKFTDTVSYFTHDKRTLAVHLTALAILLSLGASPLGSSTIFQLSMTFCSSAYATALLHSKIVEIDEAMRSKIDDNQLKPYFLTADRMRIIEQDLDKGNHKGMLTVTNVAVQDRDFIPVLSDAHALSWFTKQVEKLIVKKALPDEHYEQLYNQLKDHWIDDQTHILILCRSNWSVKINKLAFLLASPYYRTQVQSNFNDAKAKTLNCPDASYKALHSLNQYLSGRRFGNLCFADALDLLNLARLYQIKPLETKVAKRIQNILEERISKATDRKTCELILKELQDNCDFLEESIAAELQCKTLAKLYGIECCSKTPFYLFENCFNIPFYSLHLLQEKGILEEHLKHVNCISMPLDISSSSLAKLKLYPEDLTKFESMVFEMSQNPDSYLHCSEIIKMLPNLKTIYLLPHDGVLNISNFKKIEKMRNLCTLPIKILVNVEMVDSKSPLTEITIINLVDFDGATLEAFKKITFTNLSDDVNIYFEDHLNNPNFDYNQHANRIEQLFNQTHAESAYTFKISNCKRGRFTLNVNNRTKEQIMST